MRLNGFARRLRYLALALAGLVAVFLLLFRSWHLSWGATYDEAHRRLPGDEIVPAAQRQETRATTILAPASEVYPWLAQLGQDRGGFYSYEILEDLVGCEITNTERIRPEFQSWKIGDKLWMYPPSKLDGIGFAVLRHHEPGRALGFATRQVGTSPEEPEDGSWSFIVEPTGEHDTRLIVRSRAGGERGFFGAAFDRLVFEPMHFVMERKMMAEIKARAEGRPPTPARDTFEVLLWTLAFAVFVGSGLLLFWSNPETAARKLAVFAGAGVVFQLLTLTSPSLVLGASLVFALLGSLTWAFERREGGPAASGMVPQPQA
jgi:hypothetical protein